MQAENTSEWDKRELLEKEKQGLERENRRLKVQVKEMEELLHRRNRLSENLEGPDFKTSGVELQEKNKVWELFGSKCPHFLCISALRTGGYRLNFHNFKPEYIFLYYLLSDSLIFSRGSIKCI